MVKELIFDPVGCLHTTMEVRYMQFSWRIGAVMSGTGRIEMSELIKRVKDRVIDRIPKFRCVLKPGWKDLLGDSFLSNTRHLLDSIFPLDRPEEKDFDSADIDKLVVGPFEMGSDATNESLWEGCKDVAFGSDLPPFRITLFQKPGSAWSNSEFAVVLVCSHAIADGFSVVKMMQEVAIPMPDNQVPRYNFLISFFNFEV